MLNETSNGESIPRINNIGINNLALYGYLLNVPDKLNLSSITNKLPVTKIFGKNMNIGNLKSFTNTASIAGAAGTAVSAILGDKSEYSGDKGYISKGMDSAYDTLSDAVSVIPGWGLAASGIMKAAGAMNLVMGKLGNSNDGMTTQDAILSSKLFNFGGLNPISMVANYGGKRSILLKDRDYQDLLSLIDSNEAYTASANTLQDARNKAGKKYSLFSNGARHGANNLINQADLESDIRLRISDDRDLSMIRSQSQTSINNQGYSNLIGGGLNPIAVGRKGMKMKRSRLKNIVNKANSINSFQKGGKSKPKFEDWYKTVPKEKSDTTNYDLEKAYVELPFEELELFRTIPEKHLDGRFKKPNHMTYSDEGYGWIGSDKIGWTFYPSPRQQQLHPYEEYVEYWNRNEPNSILNYNGKIYKVSPQTFKQSGKSEYKKVKSDKAYYDKDSDTVYYTNDEDLIHEGFHARPDSVLLEQLKPYYENLNDEKILNFGGNLLFVKRFEGDPGHFYSPEELGARVSAAKFRTKGNNYTPEFFKYLRTNENLYGDNMRDLLYMYNDENLSKIFNLGNTQSFKQGGQMNVIPEGALHARKNNMEGAGEDFTAKGIPVVDNNGELQAEIERNEVIFNKEVTDFIEKNYKKFKSEETSNSEKDEIAIRVGKRLVKELLENTQDNTGLIQEVLEKM